MLGHRIADRYPRTPEGWTLVERRAVGPFTTRVEYRDAAGERRVWSSRFQRKHASLLSRADDRGSRWWAPHRASWWIGVLFAIGSVFFTWAALIQYLEAANADRDLSGKRSHRMRLLTFEPHRIDWWATGIQLVGTVFFNINTFRAMQQSFDTSQVDRLVWAPEAVGSICFLISGLLAYLEVRDGGLFSAARTLEWRISTVKFAGCILFGISAVAGYIVPETGDELSLAAANVTTSLGALCFLIGALISLPEANEPQR